MSKLKASPTLSPHDVAISATAIRVAYRSYKERPTTVKESIIKLLTTGTLKHYSTFDAIRNLSVTVKPGEVLGLVGSNGSGKSTLLKVIAKVLKPTEGSVVVTGSMASLIELGAGFDPELNAIENIFLNGSLHRKSQMQLQERVPHILKFAELEEFATTPVKYFSSGMYARLGFSAAIDLNPDILVVDEILSVGDERFQEKCNAIFAELLARKKTIIIVSHDMQMLERMCSRVLVLSRGQVVYDGAPETGISFYRSAAYATALHTI